jgi:hypothetical protein
VAPPTTMACGQSPLRRSKLRGRWGESRSPLAARKTSVGISTNDRTECAPAARFLLKRPMIRRPSLHARQATLPRQIRIAIIEKRSCGVGGRGLRTQGAGSPFRMPSTISEGALARARLAAGVPSDERSRRSSIGSRWLTYHPSPSFSSLADVPPCVPPPLVSGPLPCRSAYGLVRG